MMITIAAIYFPTVPNWWNLDSVIQFWKYVVDPIRSNEELPIFRENFVKTSFNGKLIVELLKFP